MTTNKKISEEKICNNCGKIFLRRIKIRKGRQPNNLRGIKMITCSKKCSVEWQHKRLSVRYKSKREFPIKFCIVCGKNFEINRKSRSRHRIYRRPIYSKTCSKNCSKEYLRELSAQKNREYKDNMTTKKRCKQILTSFYKNGKRCSHHALVNGLCYYHLPTSHHVQNHHALLT